ncbi:unnamed protein product [Symbiodinium natans]|uniref:Fibronectin type-III domain-containing protein n=1 Tax=Symbiodinium natans TaxID=878477 RepID=A0A812QFL3_9DINO|nr:unnamed protein product [Symbiodinium natans]
MSNLFYLNVATDLTVLVTVDALGLELLHMELVKEARPSQAQSLDEVTLTDAGLELRRAIGRLGPSTGHSKDVKEVVHKRLERLLANWLRTRPHAVILRQTHAQPALRLFVDRVGSNVAEVSWELLGGRLSVAFFEVTLLGYQRARRREGDPQLQKLGTFAVSGGGSVRTYCFNRLEPLRWHRARVRAVGPHKSWVSEWSNEVSFRTLSLLDAKDAGLHVVSDGFLVKSERLLQKCVTDQDVPLPTREELQVRQVRQLLGASTLQSCEAATTKLLNARYSKGGWPDFVRQGARFSRPAASREERMKRMQLAIAAEELFGPVYPRNNEWCQGPFYYEPTGLKILRQMSSS